MTAHAPDADAPAALLRGQNIFITGAGAGIGRSLAIACAGQGAQVLLLGRSQQHLEAVYDAIVAAGGAPPILVPGNLEHLHEEAAEQIGDAVLQQCGALHALVHNAATLGPRVPLAFYPERDWQQVLQVNLTAPFVLTRALLPVLQAAARARIVFSSASDGLRGAAYWGAYAVSKFGVEGLAQVLRDELAATSGIRVHVVDPGPTRTALRAAAFRAEDPREVPGPDERVPLYMSILTAPAEAQTADRITGEVPAELPPT